LPSEQFSYLAAVTIIGAVEGAPPFFVRNLPSNIHDIRKTEDFRPKTPEIFAIFEG
jgi:hypothetical protein